MIQGHFIIQRIGTSTDSCAISGGQILRRPARAQARLRIIGSTTPTFPSCRRNDTVTAAPVAASGDVVHMIPFCIQVLQGRVPEQNERKITKPVALILLAHYVADIHQPLHVGAEYFNQQGRVVDPDKDKSALGDEGGNTFTLELSDEPPRRRGIHKKKLHGFWDYDAVNALFPQVPAMSRKSDLQALIEPYKRQLVHEMAMHEPNSWRMPPNLAVDGYAEIWADEILPVAGEAYARLQFTDVHSQQEEAGIVAAGEAVEKPIENQMNYRAWATGVVRQELHKAGWRLADLLEKIL